MRSALVDHSLVRQEEQADRSPEADATGRATNPAGVPLAQAGGARPGARATPA